MAVHDLPQRIQNNGPPLRQRDKSNGGIRVGLGAIILDSADAFITACTDDSRFRQLFRQTSLVRTPCPRLVLQRCFLPMVFIPIPVCLMCSSLSSGSARWLSPGHTRGRRFGWISGLEQPVPVSRTLPVRTTWGVTATDKWKTDTPVHLVPSTVPGCLALGKNSLFLFVEQSPTLCILAILLSRSLRSVSNRSLRSVTH